MRGLRRLSVVMGRKASAVERGMAVPGWLRAWSRALPTVRRSANQRRELRWYVFCGDMPGSSQGTWAGGAGGFG